MSIEVRAKLLIEQLRITQRELEVKSGISQQVWSKALNGKQRLNSDHLEFLCREYKDYAFWLTTGFENSTQTLVPGNAKYIEAFEPIARKYAESLTEIEYMACIEEFFRSLTVVDSEFDVPKSSPMPAVRKDRLIKIEQQLLSQDLSEYIRENKSASDDDLEYAAQNYFYEKALNHLVQIQNEYGRDHKMVTAVGRMLGEFLLPGSKSNVMSLEE